MKWQAIIFPVFIVSTLSTTYCTQVPQEEESVASVSRKVNCVDSGEDLYHEFIRRGRVSGRYLFDVHTPGKQFYTTYTTFTVVFNTIIANDSAHYNASLVHAQPLISSDRCCNPSNERCLVLQSAVQSTFLQLPPQLVYMLVGPWLNLLAKSEGSHVNEFIGCWSTPPFCNRSQDILVQKPILEDFTVILIRAHHGVEAKAKILSRFHSLASKDNSMYSIISYSLSALMSLLTLLQALKLLKRYKPPRNKLVPTLWTAAQINSWWHFSVFIASYQVSFNKYHRYLADAPQEVISILLPYSTYGDYFVLALGGIFLLELPLVMWYIVHNVLTAATRQKTCFFHCKKLASAFGLTGIVFFLQIVGGYSVYFLFGLLAFPIAAVYSLALHAVVYIFFTALIAIVIYPCMARTCRRSCFQECGMLLYIFLGSVGALGFIAVLVAVVIDNLTAPLNSGQIATSIMSSCLFALMAYIAKKTLWNDIQKAQNAVREDEETALLYLKDNVE